MKWTNKGHEYDDTYEQINNKSGFYLFGAGDYGTQFIKLFGEEINVIAYIDNSSSKQGTIINGVKCISLEEAIRKLDESIGIIVTMSQIARIHPIEQLKEKELKEGKNYFVIEEFISIYQVYKNNKVYLSSISFLPSTVCNLNCRNCLNFNPFAKRFFVREWNEIKKDIDLFFSCVDKIMLFHISGGEPFLYKHTAELIEYIDTNYGDRIGTLRTVTNGTQVPTDEILTKLSKCKIEITVDDYREAVPVFNERFEQLISKLEQYGIKYYINKADSWIDLAPEKTDYSDKDDMWMIEHRNLCNQSWQELRGGKIYSCNYASYAVVAGLVEEQDIGDAFDLTQFDESKKKELIEFRLGYTDKGYTSFCKKCRGFTAQNSDEVQVAMQVSRGQCIVDDSSENCKNDN